MRCLLAEADRRSVRSFGLAPNGACTARAVAGAAVRSYRTFSPLPLRAVCFLLRFPSRRVVPAVPAFRRAFCHAESGSSSAPD